MNTLSGLSLFIKMGCVCGKETIFINNRRFYIRSSLGEGYVQLFNNNIYVIYSGKKKTKIIFHLSEVESKTKTKCRSDSLL